jgi:hypothetical protein
VTGKFLTELVDILADLPLTQLDLRDNERIGRDIVKKIQRRVPHVAIKIKSATKKKQKWKPTRVVQPTRTTPIVKTHEAVSVCQNKKKHGGKAKRAMAESHSERIVLAPEFLEHVNHLCSVTDSILQRKGRARTPNGPA